MGKYSDDPAVEEAVLAAEADYMAAQEAYNADLTNSDAKAAYDAAGTALANARAAARGDRAGFGVVTGGGE